MRVTTRQCKAAVSALIVCGAALRLFQGPSIFTALLWWSSHFACVVFACACVKAFFLPALPSLWMGVGKKFPLHEVLSVSVPGGCRSQGCLGYLHARLRLPQFTKVSSPHPSINDCFKTTKTNKEKEPYLSNVFQFGVSRCLLLCE